MAGPEIDKSIGRDICGPAMPVFCGFILRRFHSETLFEPRLQYGVCRHRRPPGGPAIQRNWEASSNSAPRAANKSIHLVVLQMLGLWTKPSLAPVCLCRGSCDPDPAKQLASYSGPRKAQASCHPSNLHGSRYSSKPSRQVGPPPPRSFTCHMLTSNKCCWTRTYV